MFVLTDSIRLKQKMVLALILKLLKLQKLLKSCRANFMYVYLIFVIRYFCRINHRCNKDVILNTELLLCLVWPYLIVYMRKRL